VANSLLDKILEDKWQEATRSGSNESEAQLLARAYAAHPRPRPFVEALLDESRRRPRVIAELKRRSPSAGELVAELDPMAVAKSYEANGAAALSVLTDRTHFGGSAADLTAARQAVALPVLRKDFLISTADVLRSRIIGADAVLLIVAALEDPLLREMMKVADELAMAALVEVHDEAELERALAAGATLVGGNNRNLKTLQTDLSTFHRLAAKVPPGVVLVAESGLSTAADLLAVAGAGASAVLIGEALLRAKDPGAALGALTAVAP
jgi:indole-3-glycerol phosphate synthase